MPCFPVQEKEHVVCVLHKICAGTVQSYAEANFVLVHYNVVALGSGLQELGIPVQQQSNLVQAPPHLL